MKRPTLLASALTLSLSGYIFNAHADNILLDHSQRQLTLTATDIRALLAQTGAGSLEIMGVEGLKRIEARAEIYSDGETEARFTLERVAGKAKLVADFQQKKGFFFGIHASPYMDVTLRLPAQLALELKDGSGDIAIRGLDADIKITDGSGELTVRGGRNLSIDDGSGDIQLSGNRGKINLKDGSGAIAIEDAGADIKIADGSGDIRVANVGGDVDISDGSGGIRVQDIRGKVSIRDGSGDIRVVNTQGLTIAEAGSGDVAYDKIDGEVSVH